MNSHTEEVLKDFERDFLDFRYPPRSFSTDTVRQFLREKVDLAYTKGRNAGIEEAMEDLRQFFATMPDDELRADLLNQLDVFKELSLIKK